MASASNPPPLPPQLPDRPNAYATLDRTSLTATIDRLEADYQQVADAGLALDLTRGKPSGEQVSLANHLDGILQGDFLASDGTDTRNYGGLRGIPEARALGGELLDAPPDLVLAGDNSSLTLMYLYVDTALHYGPAGPGTAWASEARASGGRIKFLCPVPGYDRHFTICEQLGIEMIPVPMASVAGSDGPRGGPVMEVVESLVAADPLIKGIWCVPKHSNPSGVTYSDDTVDRFAALAQRAGPNFRIMWDNAYAVHDFGAARVPLKSLMSAAAEAGSHDSVVATGSTSKITFAGAGISFLASSAANLSAFEQRLSAMSIGPDKVNQLRHVRLLPDLEQVHRHMDRHAASVRPKFALCQTHLAAELGELGIASWTQPTGGYFISFDTLPGLAKQTIGLAADVGVRLTPAGSTFPGKHDPNDQNIRLAPTYPTAAELAQALSVFTLCVKLSAARQAAGKG